MLNPLQVLYFLPSTQDTLIKLTITSNPIIISLAFVLQLLMLFLKQNYQFFYPLVCVVELGLVA